MEFRDFDETNSAATDDILLLQTADTQAYYRIRYRNLVTSSNWISISNNYQASSGDRLIIFGTNIEINLPAMPEVGDEVFLCWASPNATNSISPQGQKIAVKSVDGANYLIWVGSDVGWLDLFGNLVMPISYKAVILSSQPYFYLDTQDLSGSVAIDESGNNRHGTYLNVQLQAEGRNPAIKAISFGGSGMIFFGNTVTNPINYMMEGWFKTASASGSLFGFSNVQKNGGTNYDRDCFLQQGKLRYTTVKGSALGVDLITTQAFNDNKWHVFTLATSQAIGTQIWIDGSLVASTTQWEAENYTGYWHLGYSVRGGYFVGAMQQLSYTPSIAPNIAQRHVA